MHHKKQIILQIQYLINIINLFLDGPFPIYIAGELHIQASCSHEIVEKVLSFSRKCSLYHLYGSLNSM